MIIDNDLQRFWRKVEFSPTCWIRKGCKLGLGYNVLHWNKKQEYAHRISWVIHFGSIPKGLSVCHTCDVPNCVNPNHLFIGTQLDNLRDMIKKGRRGYTGHKGEEHRSHKLTNRQVKKIRILWNTGKYTQQFLGNKYGVNQTVISNIVHRKTWRHL